MFHLCLQSSCFFHCLYSFWLAVCIFLVLLVLLSPVLSLGLSSALLSPASILCPSPPFWILPSVCPFPFRITVSWWAVGGVTLQGFSVMPPQLSADPWSCSPSPIPAALVASSSQPEPQEEACSQVHEKWPLPSFTVKTGLKMLIGVCFLSRGFLSATNAVVLETLPWTVRGLSAGSCDRRLRALVSSLAHYGALEKGAGKVAGGRLSHVVSEGISPQLAKWLLSVVFPLLFLSLWNEPKNSE